MREPIDLADSAERTRAALAAAVARFSEAWASGFPPDLSSYLPREPADRHTMLIELIKVDLEFRWLRYHFPKRLIDYRAEFPELRSAPFPADLVYEEFHAMRRGGHGDAADSDGTATATAADPDLDRITSDYRSTMIARPSAQVALEAIDVGDRVDDFDLLMRIGVGAFAQVYLARQQSMQRLVAVKISHNHGNEPQTLAQLDHEYIVRIFDQRLIADGELKLLYMQYLPGGTLLDVLRLSRTAPQERRGGQLLLDAIDQVLADKGEVRPTESAVRLRIAGLTWPETVVWLGRRLADALQHASERGVLHRDIKPANVLLSAEGIPKLADFNVSFSKRVRGTSPLAYFGGSLAYMSPEQLEACHPDLPVTAADLDTRSDIFALAVMLWELLTGRRPFADETSAGDSQTSLARMIELRRKPVDPAFLSQLPPDCPMALRRVLLKCLSPDRADRYSSGSELAQQLDLCLEQRARDLVYPAPGSWRARLARRPTPVLWLSSLVGVGLATIYMAVHVQELIRERLPDHTNWQLNMGVFVFVLVAGPLSIVIYALMSRDLLAVPRGLRAGRRYDDALLARVRSRTLFWGDMCALNTFQTGITATVTGVFLCLWLTDLPARLVVHAATTVLMAAVISVAYTFFLSTFYIVRCVYPVYLRYSRTTAHDSGVIRTLRRRTTVYLAVTASVPLVGVLAGFSLLEPEELPLVRDSVLGLCAVGGLAFVAVYWLFRTLDADLRALQRVVGRAPESVR
ncbi:MULTISPECIES: serine/threonine-protein kinase [Nocardia]|uniref:Serine/threonine-protein kinase n=1 Tax=Nocardia implantans TaxID=3108168 RepID=A0ABU6AUC6_9NOCA|nr:MULTISPECIES: serine/threonine-protein kinase [unclassified Nocardia]MBF6192708.1 serine/threonine protein kinase [Nocardia beijingensis]MEA3527384.1 serine/threonine-protein kinase [Nocardia sp. CDC192]MEB3511092.1 serine/threonine-protein kinase [Nocardia sp. CDC186]